MTKKHKEEVRQHLVKLKLMESGELTRHGKEIFRIIKSGCKQRNHIVDYSDDLFNVCNLFNIKTERCLHTKVQLYAVDDCMLRTMYDITKYKALIN